MASSSVRPRSGSGNQGSFLHESAQDVPATAAALSFADPGVTRPVNLREETLPKKEDDWAPSLIVRMCLIALCLYCAPAVALFQQYYKDTQKFGGGDECNVLFDKIVEGFGKWHRPDETERTVEIRRLNAEGAELRGSGDWQAALDGFWGVSLVKTSKETAGADGVYFDDTLQHRECVWYLVETKKSPRSSFMWKDKEQEYCGRSSVGRKACDTKPGCAFLEAGEAPAGEEGAGCYFEDCVEGAGRTCYKRVIHTYDKGFSLFVQSIFALFVHWYWAYLAGGKELFYSCFDMSKVPKFAVIGFLFGFSAVFGFLGQAKLTPGSYLIVGQSSIIIVPLLWRVVFWTSIPVLSQVHIGMTAMGIYMYFMADMEPGGGNDSVIGVVYGFMKVSMSAIAAVNSDKYLKTMKDIPFPVQVAYVLPFKAIACLATTFILPPHRFPPAEYRPGWAFHDMNLVVVVILLHSLGDTIISGVIVKVFDAVAKALVAVCGIIFPTWVVSYLLGWDTIEWSTDQGKLKVSGAVVVVSMAFAYALGRSQAKELSSKTDRVAELEAQQARAAAGGLAPAPAIELRKKDSA